MTTMDDKYKDGSTCTVCDVCGYCIDCGDCEEFGCGWGKRLCAACCWLKDGTCLKGADYGPPLGVVACSGFVKMEALKQVEG